MAIKNQPLHLSVFGTDRNFDFQPTYKEEPLIQGVRVCKGGRGRLCTHAPRPFLAMVSEMGACLSTKCTSMKAKYGANLQLVRIVPVPIRVGDD